MSIPPSGNRASRIVSSSQLGQKKVGELEAWQLEDVEFWGKFAESTETD